MSRSGVRVVSTEQRLVSMRSSRTVASRMTPVSPMPPTVAQNSSGRRSGPSSTTEPSATQQGQAQHVVAERPLDVVVLAVDVAGDGPADGHEAGARRDRDEEAPGHGHAQQVVQAHPGGDGHRPGRLVDGGVEDLVLEPQHDPAAVLGRIAVRAPEPSRDAAPRRQVLHRGGERVDPPSGLGHQLGRGPRGPPPPGEQLPAGSELSQGAGRSRTGRSR